MPVPIPYSPIVAKKPEEHLGPIQGQMPDSINEWYTAQALDRLLLDYTYQYPIGGGRSIRGGQVIDFVVWTVLGGVPVFIQGTYWHNFRNDPEGVLKQEAARQQFNNEPVLLSEDETSTQDKAFQAVRQKIFL